MTTDTCTACHDEPVSNAWICQTCGDELHGILHKLPELWKELTTELLKRTRKGARAHGKSAQENPLPYHVGASSLMREIRAELVTTIRDMAEGVRVDWPSDTVESMCDWLIKHEASLILRPYVGETLNALRRNARRARKIIDLAPERVNIGECRECAEVMMAARAPIDPRTGQRPSSMHICTCGTAYDVEEAWWGLQRALGDQLVTQDVPEKLLSIPQSTVSAWIQRGRIVALGEEPGTRRPTFRYGEFLRLNAERLARKERKGAA